MINHQQLPLNFEHRPALSDEDFLVSSCNRQAVDWIDRWPAWPASALCVHGPASCGKTHLASVFMEKSGAVLITMQDLEACVPPDVLEGSPACVVEDVDCALKGEESLLHLYNTVKETGRHMLMTASSPPARWGIVLPDLRSRLVAAPLAKIGPPDDDLIGAVLVKLFADRQLKVDHDVVGFMQTRMERSFDGARRLVCAVDELALAQHRNITVPLVRQTLSAMEEEGGV